MFKKPGPSSWDFAPPGPNWPSLGAVLHQCLPYLAKALVFMRPDTMLDLCGGLSPSFGEMGLVHDGKGCQKVKLMGVDS